MDDTQPPKPSRLRRVVAVVLSLFDAGLGHIALGNIRDGLIWFAVSGFFMIAVIVSIFVGPYRLLLPVLLLGTIVRLASFADTFRVRSAEVSFKKAAVLIIAMVVVSRIEFVVAVNWFQAFRIPTVGMYPTIHVGDRLLASLWVGKVERGDIVFYHPLADENRLYVQRVVGVAGDTVEMRNGTLVLNGKTVDDVRLDERCEGSYPGCTIWRESIGERTFRIATYDYGDRTDIDWHDYGPVVVPPSHVFLLGDNRDNSRDSRYVGTVSLERVAGRPRVIYWPDGEAFHWDRINQVID
jgi:signal peptidase I